MLFVKLTWLAHVVQLKFGNICIKFSKYSIFTSILTLNSFLCSILLTFLLQKGIFFQIISPKGDEDITSVSSRGGRAEVKDTQSAMLGSIRKGVHFMVSTTR